MRDDVAQREPGFFGKSPKSTSGEELNLRYAAMPRHCIT